MKLLNDKLGQTVGGETILECSVTSYPRASIAWIKNNVVIKYSYKYRPEIFPDNHDTNTLTLTIRHINKHDYGDYVCRAENRMGIQNVSMLLYGEWTRQDGVVKSAICVSHYGSHAVKLNRR